MSLKENADAKNQEQSKIEKKKEENEAGNPPAPVAEKEAGNPPAPVAEKGSVRRLSGPPSTKKKVRRLPPDFGKRVRFFFFFGNRLGEISNILFLFFDTHLVLQFFSFNDIFEGECNF